MTRASAPVVALVVGAVLSAQAVTGPAAWASPTLPVPADPAAAAGPPVGGLADAGARAAALRTAVDRLTLQAAQATQRYDAAAAELARLAAETVQARRQEATLADRAHADQSIEDRRIRALYMAGGPAGLVNSVLGAGSLTDAAARIRTVQDIVAADRQRAGASAALADQGRATAVRLADLAGRQAQASRAAEAAAGQIRAALAGQQQLLAAADAAVRQAAAEQRRAAEAAAAAAFAAQLAAARGGFATGLPTGGDQAPTALAAAAVAAARSAIGRPYVWGAAGPAAFDCSGLTSWAYRQAGIALPRTAAEQASVGRPVGLAGLAPGDLLFWATDPRNPATIYHVAIYAGAGQVVSAPQPGETVRLQPAWSAGYYGAVRPVG